MQNKKLFIKTPGIKNVKKKFFFVVKLKFSTEQTNK